MQFLILGSSVQNTNRGVSALGYSALRCLKRAFPSAKLVVCESGTDLSKKIDIGNEVIEYETCWLNAFPGIAGRSRMDHLRWLRRLNSVFPGIGTKWLKNRTYRQILNSDVIFDLSGGDSFSDIYGAAVFDAQCDQKRFVSEFNKPLVLLPQTLGPYSSDAAKSKARNVLKLATIVATRERDGLREMEEWYGSLDSRFVRCPDLAFSMQPIPVPQYERPLDRSESTPLIGINVSGLLWESNADLSAASKYRDLFWASMEWSMSIPNAHVLLVPHVFNKRRTSLSPVDTHGLNEYPELELTLEIAQQARERWGSRVHAIDQPYLAPELKWIIGQCDFFMGARMHACIAGLSQAVPTVVLAYSKKAAGVLGMLDAQELVVDLRDSDTNRALRQINDVFNERNAWRERLQSQNARALQEIEQFFRNLIPKVLASG